MWFVQYLHDDLDLGDGVGWTIISDQQKVMRYMVFFFNLRLNPTHDYLMFTVNEIDVVICCLRSYGCNCTLLTASGA